jgi:tetratricopeptide (TPR) repeat protein
MEKNVAIIEFVKNTNLRGQIRDTLKEMNIENVIHCENQEQCRAALSGDAKAWLVFDAASDLVSVAGILKAAQAVSPILTRPIYMVTTDISKEILSIALEFYVLKVRSGEVNLNAVKSDLQTLISRTQGQGLIHEIMPEIIKYRADGRWDGAIASLKVAQMADPTNDSIALELADTRVAAGDLDTAMETVSKVLERSAANLRALHIKSRILMKQKKFEEATQILQDAEQNSLYNPGRLVDLGECLLNLERFKEATERFNRALAIDAEDSRAKSGQAKAMILQGDVDQALELIANFSSDEQIAATLNSAAVIAMRQKKGDSAMTMYEQCIKLLAKNETLCARVWFNFGIAHHKQHNLEKASACFEMACMLDPTFTHAAHNYYVVTKQLAKQGKKTAPAAAPLRPSITVEEKLFDDNFYAESSGSDES